MKLFVVDEREEGRRVLERDFGAAGLSLVGEAGSPAEAFTLVRQSAPDVVVVSLEEPLAKSIRTLEAVVTSLPEIPVVAVSSIEGEEVYRRAMLVGARDLVKRPIGRTDLREALDLVIKLEEKRRLARFTPDVTRPDQGSIVTVFGPKGGIGKSTLALNLAVTAASKGKERVVLVDLDTQVGAAAVMMNLIPSRTVTDLVDNLEAADEQMIQSCITLHQASGLHLLASPLWSRAEVDPFTGAQIADLLTTLSLRYEYVVVDCPPIISPQVVSAMRISTFVVIMTSLEIASLQATKRALDQIRSWDFAKERIKLVTNVANSANSVGKSDIEEVLEFPVFWTIPFDSNVAAAAQAGNPLVQLSPKSKASQSISKLMLTLSRPSDAGAGRGLFGFLRS